SVFARLELQGGANGPGQEEGQGGANGPGQEVRQQRNDGPPREERDGTLHHGEALFRTKRFHIPVAWTLEGRARALLEDTRLEPELWAETMVLTNYNRGSSSGHGKTPWEMFYAPTWRKPNLSHLWRVFGAQANIHVPKGNRKKMEPVSERGVFLGFDLNFKSYRVLRERDGRLLTFRDIIGMSAGLL
ncbi:hypothetical protein KFL_013630010, partial [Klebsormidium nitens]